MSDFIEDYPGEESSLLTTCGIEYKSRRWVRLGRDGKEIWRVIGTMLIDDETEPSDLEAHDAEPSGEGVISPPWTEARSV